MKAKQPLLLAALAVIMLVALFVVPGVALAAPGGSGGGQPVNWASFVCDSNNDTAFRTMDAIHVQKLQDGTVRGRYLDQSTGEPGDSEYRFSSRDFASECWDEFMASQELPSLSHAYFCHGADYPDWLWPGWYLPSNWADFADADIADFVVYTPVDQVGPDIAGWFNALGLDSLPIRYVLLDFGEPGAGSDQFMCWVFFPGYGWLPMSNPDGTPILGTVALPNGNIQVHVGAPDF